MATATLVALRRGYPLAHITWAVGNWSKAVVEGHPALDAILDTGTMALPVKSVYGFWRFVQQLRGGRFDLAVSLVRSPLMSLAVMLSGIPMRAGLNSGGRGFGYTIRAPIDPQTIRHEAEIYLDVARALGLNTTDCMAQVPVKLDAVRTIRQHIGADRFIVIHPGGGRNPGMVMDTKRWPPGHFSALANRLVNRFNVPIVLIGGLDDAPLLQMVAAGIDSGLIGQYAGIFSFDEIAALGQAAWLYIGNDTGMTHLAAAAGGRAIMILGPSDPRRYAPFTPHSLALWKPTAINPRGVSSGVPQQWDWQRDGISVDEAEQRILDWLAQRSLLPNTSL